MARETKIGVALMVLLLGVFGAVAYKKWDALKAAVAAKSDKDKGETKAAEEPAGSPPEGQDDLQPDANPFVTADSAPAPPTGQDEPGSPFMDSAEAVPVREVSAAAGETGADATPPAQAEPFADQAADAGQGANTEEQAVATRQDEPSGQTAAAASESAEATSPMSDTGSTAAAVGSDPFGAAAAAPVAGSAPDGAGQPLADDPFGAAGEQAAPSEATTSQDAALAVEADGPFSRAGESTAAATQESADPFAGAPDATVADTGSESTPAESPSVPLSEDPFGETGAQEQPAAAAEIAESAAAEPRPQAGVFADSTEPSAPAPTGDTASEPQPDATFAASAGEPHVQPTSPSRSTSPVGRTDYCIVQEKDTYWSISERAYGTTAYFQALTEYNKNRIRDPKRLRPGMTVLTPPAEELQARYPKLIARGDAMPAENGGRPGFLINEAGRPAYRVGERDTLGKIAQSHLGRASRWVQIYEMNRDLIPNPKTLRPGTVLELPGDASRVRIASGE